MGYYDALGHLDNRLKHVVANGHRLEKPPPE